MVNSVQLLCVDSALFDHGRLGAYRRVRSAPFPLTIVHVSVLLRSYQWGGRPFGTHMAAKGAGTVQRGAADASCSYATMIHRHAMRPRGQLRHRVAYLHSAAAGQPPHWAGRPSSATGNSPQRSACLVSASQGQLSRQLRDADNLELDAFLTLVKQRRAEGGECTPAVLEAVQA